MSPLTSPLPLTNCLWHDSRGKLKLIVSPSPEHSQGRRGRLPTRQPECRSREDLHGPDGLAERYVQPPFLNTPSVARVSAAREIRRIASLASIALTPSRRNIANAFRSSRTVTFALSPTAGQHPPSIQLPRRASINSNPSHIAQFLTPISYHSCTLKLTLLASYLADFVQELYLKELKAYKPTPIKDTDSVGQVATFSLPKTPKSPEEADLASSLKEYETMAVEVEGQEADATKPAAVIEDWLVEEEEEAAHH